jgi:hypothetical protein
MAEIDISEFDERLNGRECSQVIRNIVACLREAADQAGPVVWRAHSTIGGGWGITGRRAKTVFCRFDPKPSVPHVCVSVVGVDEVGLKAVGRYTGERAPSGGSTSSTCAAQTRSSR